LVDELRRQAQAVDATDVAELIDTAADVLEELQRDRNNEVALADTLAERLLAVRSQCDADEAIQQWQVVRDV
jgi:hypothetical protein